MSAIDACLRANADYAAGFSKGGLGAPPTRQLAVVACMDARLETGALLGLFEGDAHVIRNAGGIVTEDVVRSLTISQHLLGTREIMLVQHTDCGMTGGSEDTMRSHIEEKQGVSLPFELGAFEDLEKSVTCGLATLRESPLLDHKDAIRGFIYEVETGRLREVR